MIHTVLSATFWIINRLTQQWGPFSLFLVMSSHFTESKVSLLKRLLLYFIIGKFINKNLVWMKWNYFDWIKVVVTLLILIGSTIPFILLKQFIITLYIDICKIILHLTINSRTKLNTLFQKRIIMFAFCNMQSFPADHNITLIIYILLKHFSNCDLQTTSGL